LLRLFLFHSRNYFETSSIFSIVRLMVRIQATYIKTLRQYSTQRREIILVYFFFLQYFLASAHQSFFPNAMLPKLRHERKLPPPFPFSFCYEMAILKIHINPLSCRRRWQRLAVAAESFPGLPVKVLSLFLIILIRRRLSILPSPHHQAKHLFIVALFLREWPFLSLTRTWARHIISLSSTKRLLNFSFPFAFFFLSFLHFSSLSSTFFYLFTFFRLFPLYKIS